MTVHNNTSASAAQFVGLILTSVSDQDLAIFARDANAELSRRLEVERTEANARKAAAITRYHYRCANGHEFIEDVSGDACPWHSYARSSNVYPDKPRGGVCDFCNGSIYMYKTTALGDRP